LPFSSSTRKIAVKCAVRGWREDESCPALGCGGPVLPEAGRSPLFFAIQHKFDLKYCFTNIAASIPVTGPSPTCLHIRARELIVRTPTSVITIKLSLPKREFGRDAHHEFVGDSSSSRDLWPRGKIVVSNHGAKGNCCESAATRSVWSLRAISA